MVRRIGEKLKYEPPVFSFTWRNHNACADSHRFSVRLWIHSGPAGTFMSKRGSSTEYLLKFRFRKGLFHVVEYDNRLCSNITKQNLTKLQIMSD